MADYFQAPKTKSPWLTANAKFFRHVKEDVNRFGMTIALSSSMPTVTTRENNQQNVSLSSVSGGGESMREADADPSKTIPNANAAQASRMRLFVPFQAVLTFIILTLVFVLAHGKVADPDIWWHLHNAEFLVQTHSLPQHDAYSFTVPGHSWMNHEWLADLPYYFAWKLWGLRGIDALALSLLSLIYLGVLYLSWMETGNFKAAVLATAYAIFLGRVSFGP